MDQNTTIKKAVIGMDARKLEAMKSVLENLIRMMDDKEAEKVGYKPPVADMGGEPTGKPEEVCPKCGMPMGECTCNDGKDKDFEAIIATKKGE